MTDRLTLNLGLRYDLIDGLPVRPVAEPELRDHAERRRGRSARRHQGPRELRPGSEERHQQLAAAPRLRLRRPRQRPGRHPRRLGHLHGHGLHQLERAVRGQRRHRARASARCCRSTTSRASATRTAASTGSASRCRTSRSQNQATRRGAAVRPVHRSAAADAVHAADLARLVAPAGGEHGLHRRLRPRRRPRPQHPSAHQHASSSAIRTAPRRLAFLDVSPTPSAPGRRSAPRESKYTALITGIKRRMTQQLRLQRHLHAGRSEEPDRHRVRRAERQHPAGRRRCSTTTRRVYGPTSRTDARHSGHARDGLAW